MFPGRYERSHLRTLQRGIRKIRAQVLPAPEQAGSPEGRGGKGLPIDQMLAAQLAPENPVACSSPARVASPSPAETSTCSSDSRQGVEELSVRSSWKESASLPAPQTPSKRKTASQIVRRSASVSSKAAYQTPSLENDQRLTIQRAIQQYLQAHRTVGHRPKTLEWHQIALGHVQEYMLKECHLHLVHQITEETMKNWLTSVAQTPTKGGALRSSSTIETYARSARAFFRWLVERGTLSCSPMPEHAFPRSAVPLPHFVSAATFEQVMRAGFFQKGKANEAKRTAARDQALLWVLFETGITVSEACTLRVADLDPQTGMLRVKGKGGKERQMPLEPTCIRHLRSYLKQMDPTTRRGLTIRKAGGDPLFAAKGKQPLTKNGVTMVFARLRKRAGISESIISPQILRHSFALRYLQAGGDPQGLQELMGYEGMAPVRQYLRWQDQLLHEQI